VTDSLVHKLERDAREECAFHAACDRPDRETYERLMRRLNDIRLSIPRQDVLRLEQLIERLTGYRP
jgi:hypothetical protein